MKKVLVTAIVVLTLICIVNAVDLFESKCFYSFSDVYPITVQDSFLYAVNYYSGVLYAFDISDPAQIVFLDSLYAVRYAQNIYASENLLFVSDGMNMACVDISNPAELETLSFLYEPSMYIGGKGGRLYSSGYGAFKGWNDVLIYDISNKNELVKIDSITMSSTPTNLLVEEDYLYVCTGDTITVFDISGESPSQVSTISCLSYVRFIVVSGDYLYNISYNNSIDIVDISDISNPILCGSCPISGWQCKGLYRNNYLYVTGENTLNVINVSDPLNPVLESSYTPSGYAYFLGGYKENLYIGEYSYGIVGISYMNDSHLHDETKPAAVIKDAVKNSIDVSISKELISISLSSEKSGDMCIDIYDSSGRNAGRVYTGYMESGKQTISVNKDKYMKGIYFIKANVGGETITKKIYLL